MSESLQKLLEEFLNETGVGEIAVGVVDFDGKEEAYAIRGTFDQDFKTQRAASLFSMIVNFLNKTLGGIYRKDDEVEDIIVTSRGGYFILGIIESESHFLGVAITRGDDPGKIQGLIAKYKPLLLEKLSAA